MKESFSFSAVTSMSPFKAAWEDWQSSLKRPQACEPSALHGCDCCALGVVLGLGAASICSLQSRDSFPGFVKMSSDCIALVHDFLSRTISHDLDYFSCYQVHG